MIPKIHPTFAELKSFIRQWARVLHIAYTFKNGWEYHCIHDIVLYLIDKTIEDIKDDDTGSHDNSVDSRRIQGAVLSCGIYCIICVVTVTLRSNWRSRSCEPML